MKARDVLTTIYSHHLWANVRLLEQCADLNAEQLAATAPGAYDSIQDTLEHIVKAERSYFSRISTGQMYQHPEDAQPMSIEEMIQAVRTTGEGLVDWVGKIEAEDTVLLDWYGTPREVPKTTILTQVINHATEHREQVKGILTQLDIEPPDLSSWTYFDETDK